MRVGVAAAVLLSTATATSVADNAPQGPPVAAERGRYPSHAKPRPKTVLAPVLVPRRPTVVRGWVTAMQSCIRRAESTDNYRAINPTGRYFGAYQFSRPTWHSTTGLPGTADLYPAAVQDAAFLRLFAGGRGRHQWSTYGECRAQLGGPA